MPTLFYHGDSYRVSEVLVIDSTEYSIFSIWPTKFSVVFKKKVTFSIRHVTKVSAGIHILKMKFGSWSVQFVVKRNKYAVISGFVGKFRELKLIAFAEV